MSTRRRNRPTSDRDLRTRILEADDTLRVSDLLELDAEVPESIAQPFLALGIVWGSERFWGEAPDLAAGETSITLGSKRGHHIASHPELCGYDVEDAAEILRAEVEGTLLHELGHCLLRAALATDSELMRVVESASAADGPVTTYEGPDPDEGPSKTGVRRRDRLHEQWSEAFRWWHADPDAFAERWPAWSEAIDELLDAVESADGDDE